MNELNHVEAGCKEVFVLEKHETGAVFSKAVLQRSRLDNPSSKPGGTVLKSPGCSIHTNA